MRVIAWRFALVAVLACLHQTPFLAAQESSTQAASDPLATSEQVPQTKRDQTDLSLPLESVLPVPSQKKAIDPAAPGMDEFGRLLGYITLLAALAGAAVYLIKFGIPMHRNRSKEERKLQVLEMRPLGNRQFLIVVAYEDTRMLLGVTPSKIDYLCALDAPTAQSSDFGRLVDEMEKKGLPK